MRRTDAVDDLIRDALSAEEAAFFDELGEPSMLRQMTELFRSRHRGLVILSFVFALVFFVLAVYCAVRFVQATEVRNMLLWGAATFGSLLAVMANKLWYWMEIQRNSLMREIKRLELQVAQLAGSVKAGLPGGRS
jgi:hypothetical protein